MAAPRDINTVAPPAWLVVLLEEQPPCFTAASWRTYLAGVRDDAISDQAIRKRMMRGAMPAYCAECTAAHRKAMQAEGRCEPLPGFHVL